MAKQFKPKSISPEQKLQKFKNSVFSEVEHSVAEILDEVEKTKEEELIIARDRELDKHFTAMQQAISDIKKDCIKKASAHELESKKGLLLKREQICNDVFSVVIKNLFKFTKSADYLSYYKKLLINTLREEKITDATIYISPSDTHLEKDILSIIGKDSEVKQRDDITIGGFFLINNTDGTAIDKTLDTKIEEQKNEFKRNSRLALNEK